MTSSPIRTAMIGGGINSAVGRTHTIAMQMDNAFKLVAGCFSRNQETNALSGQSYSVDPNRVYQSAEELLDAERGRIDAVVIATPTDSHARHIEMILDRNLVVISDKPLLSDIRECRQLLARIPADSPSVFSIFNYTGYPAVREIKNRIATGDIGRVFKIMAEMPQDTYQRLSNQHKTGAIQRWRLHDGDASCLSLDLFVHLHSLIHFVTGASPLKVVARSSSISGIADKLVDEVDALIDYEDSLTVNVWYSKVALGFRNGLRIRILGTQGSYEWIQEQPEIIAHADQNGDRHIIDRISTSSSITPELRYNRFKAGHPSGFIEAFANYYGDIAQAIHQQKLNAYTLPTSIAVEGIQLCQAIQRSSDIEREVAIAEI